MEIHQIFFNIGKGEIHEIPRFYQCHLNNIDYCNRYDLNYRLWNRDQILKLLNKPKNKQFKKIYFDFTHDIQRIDFAKYLILWNFGGIYLDLDICIMNKPIYYLYELPYFFVRWHINHRNLPYNAVLGSKLNNPLYLEILNHSKDSFYQKIKKKVYQNWKGRFVFQTTGHYMLKRILKKNNITVLHDILRINTKDGQIIQGKNPIFEDYNVSVWYK